MRWTPDAIKDLRRRYEEPQDEFCRRLGVTPNALRIWEQGRGAPSGSAQLLLDRLEEDFETGKVRELQPA